MLKPRQKPPMLTQPESKTLFERIEALEAECNLFLDHTAEIIREQQDLSSIPLSVIGKGLLDRGKGNVFLAARMILEDGRE